MILTASVSSLRGKATSEYTGKLARIRAHVGCLAHGRCFVIGLVVKGVTQARGAHVLKSIDSSAF